MSAYLVDPAQIGILAAYAAKYNLLKYAPCHTISAHDASTAAQTLAKANIESVEHRYPDSNAAQDFMGVTRNDYLAMCVQKAEKEQYTHFSAAQLAKLCDNLEYQSCEHDEWYSSAALKILDAIRKELLRQLPDYDDAKWGL